MIPFSINLDKIDESLIKPGKNGGRFLNLIMIENSDGPSQYGDTHFIKHNFTKEERERMKREGIKAVNVGYGKQLERQPNF